MNTIVVLRKDNIPIACLARSTHLLMTDIFSDILAQYDAILSNGCSKGLTKTAGSNKKSEQGIA